MVANFANFIGPAAAYLPRIRFGWNSVFPTLVRRERVERRLRLTTHGRSAADKRTMP
jgi:hypothetical protein